MILFRLNRKRCIPGERVFFHDHTSTRLGSTLAQILGQKAKFISSKLHTYPAAHRRARGLTKSISNFVQIKRCEFPYNVEAKILLLCALLIAAVIFWAPPIAAAQQAPVAVADDAALPNAPGFGESIAAPAEGEGTHKASATISGTVLDTNGSEVQNASVKLTGRAGTDAREVQTGGDGEFSFADLPADTFHLTVTGPGMGTYVSPAIKIRGGDYRIVPHIVLPVAAATSAITVMGDKEEISEQQVQIAVQQRVLKIFPNFYSAYDWNAPPMQTKQKFQLAFRAMIDPMAFAGAAGVAGAEQYYNIFPSYGGGIEGYSKRYGAAYANDFSGRMFSSAIFPSIFHQDPRYFYMGTGSIRKRALYAMSAAVIARGDNGRWQPNYSEILGNFAAGALSNLYYPADSRGVTLTIGNALIETAGRAGTNLVREFVLRGLTAKVPAYDNGKP